jgi:hypothetical protein
VNLDDLGVPHFICRVRTPPLLHFVSLSIGFLITFPRFFNGQRLPYPLQKEEVITFDSLVSVAIDHASVQLQQPFTGVCTGPVHFSFSHSVMMLFSPVWVILSLRRVNRMQVKIGEYKLGSTDDNYNILGYGVEAIGGESDQKLFYMRVAEQYTDSDIILLFITTRVRATPLVYHLCVQTHL